MIKANTSQFKAKLGRYMRAVREGNDVVVLDRDRPVARLVPFVAPATDDDVAIVASRDPSAPPLGEIRVQATRVRGLDTTAVLRQERDRR